MQYIVPDYFDQFACIAGKCPDTCCAGWKIMIDEDSLKKYDVCPDLIGNRLHNEINWKEGSFYQNQRRCAFLNEENLCDIYAEAGKDMLCDTCRRYPRHIEEFEDVREVSLSLSCPVVAKMLLTRKEPVHFLTYEEEGEEVFEDFDNLLYSALVDSRNYLLEILQTREVPVNVRMAKVLVWAYDLQTALEHGKLFSMETLMARHRQRGYGVAFSEKILNYRMKKHVHFCDRYHLMQKIWKRVLPHFEVLNKSWPKFLKKCYHSLYGKGEQNYLENLCIFEEYNKNWEMEAQQLLVYFIFTYYCGAVYDGESYTKALMAVVAVLLIREIDLAVFARYGRLRKSDQIRICYRFSRELEHSDLNLNRFEEIVRDEREFRLENLLGLFI